MACRLAICHAYVYESGCNICSLQLGARGLQVSAGCSACKAFISLLRMSQGETLSDCNADVSQMCACTNVRDNSDSTASPGMVLCASASSALAMHNLVSLHMSACRGCSIAQQCGKEQGLCVPRWSMGCAIQEALPTAAEATSLYPSGVPPVQHMLSMSLGQPELPSGCNCTLAALLACDSSSC